MVRLLEYRGHIRNWEALCDRLNVSKELPRREREEALLLAAYKEWGTGLAPQLEGMFAFALQDDEAQQLVCVRDPFGTKPFYYYLTADGRFLCGTMIRPLLEQPGFVRELDEKVLQRYLSLTYPAGEDTFFKGLKKLMPGCVLVFREGTIRISRYFRPEFCPEEGKSTEEWADELENVMRTVMREVKTPEEHADSFLSGGVDSSYVLAMTEGAGAHSCGYEEERFDESRLAEVTAEKLGRPFHRLTVTPEAFFAAVPYVMENMEQPLGDASAIVFALGCRAAAQYSSLVFSGEGSDEFFGGYNMYRNADRYGDNLKNFYVGNTNIMKEEEKEQLLLRYDPDALPIRLTDAIYAENEGLDPLSKMQDVDIRIWLEGDIYLNVDKMSAAAGLEVRMPLTDTRLFRLAARMPRSAKLNDEQNKLAFRTAAARVLPEEIAFRKKLGFIVPIRLWLADERFNADVRRLLFGELSARFFRPDVLKQIYSDYIGGNSDLWRKIWTIYVFLVWYEIYFDGPEK